MRHSVVLLCLLPTLALAEPVTLICEYDRFSDEDGSYKNDNNFVLKFLIDDAAGKSYLLGDAGTAGVARVEHQESAGGMTFIEITEGGDVTTTTVDAQMNSVHSRNMIVDVIVPSQYYGKCRYEQGVEEGAKGPGYF